MRFFQFRLFIVLLATGLFVSCASSPKRIKVATDAQVYADPEIVERVYFESDLAQVKISEQEKIQSSVNRLNLDTTKVAQLEGHADAEGLEDYNLKLGDSRARAVREVMVGLGIDPSRLIVLSFGEGQPLSANDTAAGRAQNRRVEIKLR